MHLSLLGFIYHQFKISSNILFIILLLKTILYSKIDADKDFLVENRAIGGESLDPSNFIEYNGDDGERFMEIPYKYMTKYINDQKMWRTWSIMLIILCLIFVGVLIAFLIHNFRTSTGPFSLCRKNINENRSDDKMISSETSDYSQTGNLPMFNASMDPRHISSFQSTGQIIV